MAALSRRAFLAAAPAAGLAASVPASAWAREPASAQLAMWRGLVLEDKDGRTFQVGSGAAGLTLVKMWANWCPGCLAEMPSLVALAAAMGSRLEVVLLSHPGWWAQDRAVARQRGIPLRVAVPSAVNDEAVVREALTVGGSFRVPRSVAFRAAEPEIAWTHMGREDWSAPGTVARMRMLAGGGAGSGAGGGAGSGAGWRG